MLKVLIVLLDLGELGESQRYGPAVFAVDHVIIILQVHPVMLAIVEHDLPRTFDLLEYIKMKSEGALFN
jgi:hypothetical protein